MSQAAQPRTSSPFSKSRTGMDSTPPLPFLFRFRQHLISGSQATIEFVIRATWIRNGLEECTSLHPLSLINIQDFWASSNNALSCSCLHCLLDDLDRPCSLSSSIVDPYISRREPDNTTTENICRGSRRHPPLIDKHRYKILDVGGFLFAFFMNADLIIIQAR